MQPAGLGNRHLRHLPALRRGKDGFGCNQEETVTMKRYLIIAALLAALAVAAAARSTARQRRRAGLSAGESGAGARPTRNRRRAVTPAWAAGGGQPGGSGGGDQRRITRILFESGQTVRQGQLLVQLNDAVEQASWCACRACAMPICCWRACAN